jgi:hypothetical protein
MRTATRRMGHTLKVVGLFKQAIAPVRGGKQGLELADVVVHGLGQGRASALSIGQTRQIGESSSESIQGALSLIFTGDSASSRGLSLEFGVRFGEPFGESWRVIFITPSPHCLHKLEPLARLRPK